MSQGHHPAIRTRRARRPRTPCPTRPRPSPAQATRPARPYGEPSRPGVPRVRIRTSTRVGLKRVFPPWLPPTPRVRKRKSPSRLRLPRLSTTPRPRVPRRALRMPPVKRCVRHARGGRPPMPPRPHSRVGRVVPPRPHPATQAPHRVQPPAPGRVMYGSCWPTRSGCPTMWICRGRTQGPTTVCGRGVTFHGHPLPTTALRAPATEPARLRRARPATPLRAPALTRTGSSRHPHPRRPRPPHNAPTPWPPPTGTTTCVAPSPPSLPGLPRTPGSPPPGGATPGSPRWRRAPWTPSGLRAAGVMPSRGMWTRSP